MAVNDAQADRIRVGLDDLGAQAEEIKMFGGLCWMVSGHMAVGLTGKGGLMVRVVDDKLDAAMARPGARPMDMTGRPMRGFLFVEPESWQTGAALRSWLVLGIELARSLPPKKKKKS